MTCLNIRQGKSSQHILNTAAIIYINSDGNSIELACLCQADAYMCGCGFPMELGAKIKTMKISSGASGGIFTKISTHENFLLYGIITS